ncbi:MAG: sigma 54-interacting transcriptional regulator, partial [Acidobacteria bacterium]|nr:sigma 54-interacting transcriptional regulator [Acidobacteriota bacterium]
MRNRAEEGTGLAGQGDWRYRSLLEVMDLVALHADLDGLLPDLATSLQKVVEFDALGLVLPRRGGEAADLYTVQLASPDAPPSTTRVESVQLPPLHETRLAALWGGGEPAVLHSLEEIADYPEVAAGLRDRGKRSACFLPLTTALRPLGVIGFASPRIGTYDAADLVFLQRVAGQVAIAIDNVRHHQEALARQRQLEAERDHWRTLLEVNNAVITNLDLASLLAAVTPSLRRIVSHDYTGFALLRDEGKRIGPHALDPELPPGIDELVSSVNPEDTPFALALALGKPFDVEPTQLSWLPESLKQPAASTRVQRMCFLPLVTPRRTLGGLWMGRCTPGPFEAKEIDRAFQAAGQIAIALENALAFREIAALKDRLAAENVYLEDEIRGTQHFEEIVGESKALQRVLVQARSVADTDTAVLLLGETGTGKELVVCAIHAMSGRRSRPLVTVNCTTSPTGLLESEWFGHEKGAFTGALAQKVGRFELAHQGTLFLDEIGDVPIDLQAKLLRVLQQHEIERLGSTRTIRVDFRVIAATNRDLEEMVARREYRA